MNSQYTIDEDGILRTLIFPDETRAVSLTEEYYPIMQIPDAPDQITVNPDGRFHADGSSFTGEKTDGIQPPLYLTLIEVHPRWDGTESRAYNALNAIVYLRPDGIIACRFLSKRKFTKEEAEAVLKQAGFPIRRTDLSGGRAVLMKALTGLPDAVEQTKISQKELKRAIQLVLPKIRFTDFSDRPDPASSEKLMRLIRSAYNSDVTPRSKRTVAMNSPIEDAIAFRKPVKVTLPETGVKFILKDKSCFTDRLAYIKKHEKDFKNKALIRVKEKTDKPFRPVKIRLERDLLTVVLKRR